MTTIDAADFDAMFAMIPPMPAFVTWRMNREAAMALIAIHKHHERRFARKARMRRLNKRK